MKKRNAEIAKLNRVLQSLRAQSAGEGFEMDPNSPELQTLNQMGVPLPNDPQKNLDKMNAALQSLKDKYGLGLNPNDPDYAEMVKILRTGEGGSDVKKKLINTVPADKRKAFEDDLSRSLISFMMDPVADIPNKIKFSKEEAQALIENIKTEIDNMSSSSQLDMIKLQGLINKRNQTVEMMTNLMQKFQKTNDAIIGNMR